MRLPTRTSDARQGETEVGSDVSHAILTRPFLNVLALTLLGFGLESILRAIVPLMVLDQGGDAAIVGLVTGIAA